LTPLGVGTSVPSGPMQWFTTPRLVVLLSVQLVLAAIVVLWLGMTGIGWLLIAGATVSLLASTVPGRAVRRAVVREMAARRFARRLSELTPEFDRVERPRTRQPV
jgi:hypothetical protein